MTHEPEEIDVVILCGGLGRRLRDVVDDRPKVMAEINGRPFLNILIDYMAVQGFRTFILCVGYMADQITQYYQGNTHPVDILFSEEKQPLGTGGAIKNAEIFIRSNPFLVMNGDSFCPVDARKFVNFHADNEALISIVLASTEQASDSGVVELDDIKRIIAFKEKGHKKKGLANAGLYLFDRKVLSLIPNDTAYSLEYELFPKLINKRLYGYLTKESFIDIGTPEKLKKAKECLPGKGD